MYTATMEYHFTPEHFAEACRIWKEEIFELARTREGFVRMQFLIAGEKALALGTWEDRSYANAFMATGAFKHLLSRLEGMTIEAPRQTIWDLLYFADRSE